jgi:hypothetical protein
MAKALIIDDDFSKLANAYYAPIPNEPLDSSGNASAAKPESRDLHERGRPDWRPLKPTDV